MEGGDPHTGEETLLKTGSWVEAVLPVTGIVSKKQMRFKYFDLLFIFLFLNISISTFIAFNINLDYIL